MSGLHSAQTRGAKQPLVSGRQEQLVVRLLSYLEDLYEQIGTPLILSHPRRRRWAFVQALGATRLAHELGVGRDAVVVARRLAFYRWRYWFFLYEHAIWHEILQLGTQEWERHFLRYLTVRSHLRQGVMAQSGGLLLALALRSISTAPWRIDDGRALSWRTVWICLHKQRVRRAQALRDQLGWTAAQWRTSKRIVCQLQHLVFLPLSQRQLLALSTWPDTHLTALRQQGHALFPGRAVPLEALWELRSRDILAIAQERSR